MSDGTSTSRGARVAAFVLAALCGLLWLLITPYLLGLGNSDPAGNAMALGFAGIGIILLWILLCVLALIAGRKGTMPTWARPALLLVPASGLAAFVALELLARPRTPPWQWPILIPALAPLLIAAFCLWALTRPMSRRHAAMLLGALAAVSAAVVPMYVIRAASQAYVQSTAANLRAALAKLPADAPLWEFTPFLAAADQTIVNDARERIRGLARRQADAETMLARGDFPIRYIGSFALDLTPAVCESARALLRKRAEALVLAKPGSKPYSEIAQEVSDALSAMYWLVGYGCACDAESLAWETMAKGYSGTNYDVVLLGGLREPGKLGKTLREDPERFSQLSPQSHLKAWLKFSDDAALREQVIEGIRKLERRTADAIEILNDKYAEGSWFRLFRVLPRIDLETTPALCAAAAKVLGSQIAGTYRPKADDPRPYSELIDRTGVGRPLDSIVWLGEHGCAMPEVFDAADALVRSYQDSPARAAMLAALAKLRGK